VQNPLRNGFDVLVFLTAVLAAGGYLAFADPPQPSWLLCGAALLLLVLGRRRLAAPPVSPLWMVCLAVLAVGVGGFLLHRAVASAGGVGIVLVVGPVLSERTLTLFGTVALVIAAAGLATSALLGPVAAGSAGDPAGGSASTASGGVRPWLWVTAVTPTIMLLSSPSAVQALLHRSTYLTPDPPGQVVLGYQLAIAACAILGFLIADAGALGRVCAVLLLVGYLAAAFADGSRRFAMIPTLIAIGYFAARPSRRSWLVLLAAAAAAFSLLGVPIYLRGEQEHGLLSYLAALPGYLDSPWGWKSWLNNILIAFPITGTIAFGEPPIPHDVLLMQLNPLFGDLVGWPDVAARLRLNPFTPYSALGEIGNYGVGPTIAIAGGIGVALGYLDRRVRVWRSTSASVVGLVLVGLSVLFAVYLLQYDLRSAFRMIVYGVVLELICRLVVRRRAALPGPADPTVPTRPAEPIASR
jgi:hypothetical protein